MNSQHNAPALSLHEQFDEASTFQALRLLSHHQPGVPPSHLLLQLILADHHQLPQFGCSVSRDTLIRTEDSWVGLHAPAVMRALVSSPAQDAPLPEYDELSQADLKSLEWVLGAHSRASLEELRALTRWPSWEATAENEPLDLRLLILDFPCGAQLVEYLMDPHPGEAAITS